IHEKQGSPLEPEAEVELVVVQLSAVTRPASSPYDAFWPAPAILDIGDASLAVVATTGPTYSL
ncbi:hypothetical protein A2U01_0075502, partial [Trifolium medium]|nr:hypothetical protein [Trifolium medium]